MAGFARLDETNPETMKLLEEVAGIRYVPEGQSIEVCLECYLEHGFTDDVDAPPLEERFEPSYCAICEEELKPLRPSSWFMEL
jgi:hypothetical protein